MILIMRVLKGKVVTGVGNFFFWIEKLQDHYRAKTGMLLFPGTLNIELDAPFDLPPERDTLGAGRVRRDCLG